MRLRKESAGDFKNIVHILSIDSDFVQRPVIVRIGCAENRAFAPRHSKEDAFAFGHHDDLRERQTLALDYHTTPFSQAQLPAAVRKAVGPWPRSIDPRPSAG